MPSVKLTESVSMYVVIFKGIAPCPLLHTQVIQDKQPTHYKAHMLSGHGVLPRTILLANTTFVDLIATPLQSDERGARTHCASVTVHMAQCTWLRELGYMLQLDFKPLTGL